MRTRYHGIVTYATPEQFQPILQTKIDKKIANFVSYVHHDRDKEQDGSPIEPHYHILVATENTLDTDTVRNWFKKLVDEKGKSINTWDKALPRPADMKDYFMHANEKSQEEGKEPYKEEEIVTLCGEWEDLPQHVDRKTDFISWEEIEEGVKKGKSDIEICKEIRVSPMAYNQVRQALNIVRKENSEVRHSEEEYQEMRRKYMLAKAESEKWQKLAIENEEYRDMMHNLMVDKTTGELVNKMLELLRQPKYQMVRINPDDLEYLFDNA